MGPIDLNADLGEGGPDGALLELVTTAHVACGIHAGDLATMAATVAAAALQGVAVGAHPSYDDRAGFGRRPVHAEPDALAEFVADQIGALMAVAGREGATVTSVKAHGALYHAMAADEATADAVARAVAGVDAALVLVVPAGSRASAAAGRHGLVAVAEAFCDRAYRPDATLLGRHEPGAVLLDPEAVAERALDLARTGTARAVDGTVLALHPLTLCLHGDAPGALERGRRVRAALEGAGVVLAPFAGTR